MAPNMIQQVYLNTLMEHFVDYLLFQCSDPGGESGDCPGDLATGVHPAGVRGARRVRLHPAAGHQVEQEDQRRGRATPRHPLRFAIHSMR